MEQMRITEFQVEQHKALFSFSQNDVESLVSYQHLVEENIDALADAFCRTQTGNAKLALLIGNADILIMANPTFNFECSKHSNYSTYVCAP